HLKLTKTRTFSTSICYTIIRLSIKSMTYTGGSQMFKEQMGMNFKDYLTDIRLLNSIYDLIHTNEKVIDISEIHGFYNVSAYISSFKLHYGITPKKYRTMFQSENTKFARQNFYNEIDYEKKLSIDEIKSYLKYFKTTYINTDIQQDKEMLLLK